MTSTPYYSKRETAYIKGVAVILMFFHHLFTFPAFWIEGVSYPFFLNSSAYLSAPTKICVGVFCFLTGYAYGLREKKTFGYSVRKVLGLYLRYWATMLILTVLAVVLVGYLPSVGSVVWEMSALRRPVMCFCWYVAFYGLFMLLLPFVVRLLGRHPLADLAVAVLLVPTAVKLVNAAVPSPTFSEALSLLEQWIPCVLIGYLAVSHRLFERLDSLTDRRRGLRIVLSVLGVIVLPFGRWLLPSITIRTVVLPVLGRALSLTVPLDFLYVPLFLYALIHLIRAVRFPIGGRILGELGRTSLFLWFFSCAFYNDCRTVLQPILYFTACPFLVTVWALVLCYIPSFALDWLFRRLPKSAGNH